MKTARSTPYLAHLLTSLLVTALLSSGCIGDPDGINYCDNNECNEDLGPDANGDDTPGDNQDDPNNQDDPDNQTVEPDPTCDDGVQNGDESDIDCGGPDTDCARCEIGQSCAIGDDCASGICAAGVCAECDPDSADFGLGDGTEDDPYRVCSPAQLQKLSETLDGHFKLVGHIDFDGFDEQFTPIRSNDEPFVGTLDGGGFEIRNFKLEAPAQDLLGLFAVIGEEGSVKDLTFTDADIKGKDYVGVLAGKNFGHIDDVHIFGKVHAETFLGGIAGHHETGTIQNSSANIDASGIEAIGALVGMNKDGIIETSRTAGSVTGEYRLGGLIGQSQAGEIRESSSKVEIAAESAHHVGGLVGELAATHIEGSSATGDIKGQQWVGGLLGLAEEANIHTSYATGKITGEQRIGGLIGENKRSQISSCFAAGDVDGGRYAGGLVGLNNSGEIENAYATGVLDSTGTQIGGLLGRNEGAGAKIKNTYAFAEPLPMPDGGSDLPDGGSDRGPLIGRQAVDTPEPEASYWLGDCNNPTSSTLGTCKSYAAFAHAGGFTTWINSGIWKMSTEKGRPVLAWEED